MKKFLLSLIALLGVGTYALADEVTVADVQIKQGKTGIVEMVLNITSDIAYRDFQFDVYMPENFAILSETQTDGTIRYQGSLGDAASEHSLGRNIQDDGAIRYAGSNNDGVELKSGVLVTIPIEATADLPIGTTAVGEIKNFLISDAAGAQHTFDLTFNIEVVDPYTTLKDTDTDLPATASNVDVRVVRSIKAGVWNTICLPFAVTDIEGTFGEGTQLGEFVGCTTTEDSEGNTVSIKVKFENASEILPNHPYIIKVPEAMDKIEVLGVNIEAQETPVIERDEVKIKNKYYYNSFVGTYTPCVLGTYTLYISNNQFFYSAGNAKLKGFRGYFSFDNAILTSYENEYEIKAYISFGDEELDAIDDLRFVDAAGAVYTLDGKFIGRDVDLKKLQKGIYVVDGKKVAIK